MAETIDRGAVSATAGKPETLPSGEDVRERGREAIELWATLLRVANMIHARVSEDLASREITPEELELLLRLSRAPGNRLRMIEVSRSLLLSKSGVTRLVDRLEQRGLVERAACVEDRRVVHTTLTESGRRAFSEADPLLTEAVAAHFGCHLGAREIAAIQRGLDKVLASERAGKTE